MMGVTFTGGGRSLGPGTSDGSMKQLSNDVLSFGSDLVAIRRDLHSEPELAFAERRTGDKVAEYLKALPLKRGVGGTGLVASIGEGRPTVLLRADMDGLPIQEKSSTPYVSRRAGVMHACGHDGHVAMGAVAARVLSGRRLPGAIRVLFQPAEEGEGGAQAVIGDGVLEGVDRVFGVHLWNEMPVGTIGVREGPLMAAVDRLRIVVRGHGGHGAKPHRAADPVVAAAHVVTALQTVVSRETSPVDSAVLTIASIHGGEAFNVIPDEVVLTGTLRSFSRELRESLPGRIQRIASGVAQGLRCTTEVEVRPGNPAVVNHPEAAAIARRAALRVVGEEGVVEPERTMGGEDMALYFEKVPGCFVFVGSANSARGLAEPHHSATFDFDEDALGIGCEFLVQVAEESLRS
jgi:amidohydrolase